MFVPDKGEIFLSSSEEDEIVVLDSEGKLPKANTSFTSSPNLRNGTGTPERSQKTNIPDFFSPSRLDSLVPRKRPKYTHPEIHAVIELDSSSDEETFSVPIPKAPVLQTTPRLSPSVVPPTADRYTSPFFASEVRPSFAEPEMQTGSSSDFARNGNTQNGRNGHAQNERNESAQNERNGHAQYSHTQNAQSAENEQNHQNGHSGNTQKSQDSGNGPNGYSRPYAGQPIPQNTISLNATSRKPNTAAKASSFVKSFMAPSTVVQIDSDSDDEIEILEVRESTKPLNVYPASNQFPVNKAPYNGQPPVNHPVPVHHHDGSAASLTTMERLRGQQTATRTQALMKHLETIRGGLASSAAKISRFASEATQATNQKSRVLTEMAKLTAALNVVHDAAKYTALKRHHDTYKDILDTCDRTIKQHNRTVQETTHQLESLKLAYNSGLSQLHAVDPEASRAFAARVPAPRADPGYAPNIYNTALTDEDQNLEELINNMRPDEEIDAESVATPAALTISLLPHQRKGLAWLQQMEAKPSNKGGILADDMGLGKTVQALALILSRASEDRKRKTTLVVAPVALLKQWEAEIGSKVKPEHRLSVAIYQAGKKLKSFGHLARHDVVLVSYGTLSSEMKKHYKRVLAELDKERGSDLPGDDEGGDEGYVSPFFARNAVFHRVILDEAQWIKNKKTLASRSCAMVKASFRWCLSGTPMQNGVIELYPLIRFLKIRPYCVETRFRADIAVPIKNQSGNYGRDDTDQAMNRLRALLAALLLRRTKTSKIDGKPILSLPEKHVAMDKVVMVAEEDAFYKALEDQTAKKAQQLLQQKGVGTFSSIFTLLLRLRQACCHSYLVELGIRNAKEQAGETAWKGQYEDVIKLDGQVQRRVREEVEREETYSCAICYEPPESMEEVVLLSPCGHLLCRECVPSFFDRFAENEAPEGKRVAKCYACQRNAMEAHCIGYGMFEKVWVLGWARDRVVAHYTAASPRPKSRDQQVSELIRESGGEFTPSAKMDQAVTLVEEILAKDPSEKIIIFSQFTLLFNLLKLVLDAKGIQFLRYDGSMSGDERNNTIGRFYNEPERSVLLLSLKAGNVGLTLTCANHVIIMDPFWNPFVEEQAMDRAHRIGQHKEVFVHRLLISDTVEDRIMKLQETKKELVESALDEKGMKVAGSLGRQELGFLFGLNKLR